jgi:hypothetical protein
VTVSVLQAFADFAAAATPLEATLPAPATAGNALLFCIGGDKDLGTVSVDSGSFDMAVYVHTADVSLVMAWREAVGGEQTITATNTSGNGAGSNLYIAELQDPDSANAWEEKATPGTNATTAGGAGVITLSSGTTGTIAPDGGMAFAGFSVDSTNASPATPSYTNGYTSIRAMGNGGNEAGLWVGSLLVAAGGTTSTVINRDPGATGLVTADQMHGGVIVLGRAVGGGPATPGPAPRPRIHPRTRAALLR